MTELQSTRSAEEAAADSAGIFRQVWRNARRSSLGIIFWVAGRFLATLIVASGLDPESFGYFAVAMSLVMAVERSFNVQSWQLVSRFSPDLRGRVEYSRLRSVFFTALSFDFIGATLTVVVVYIVAGRFSEELGISALDISTISMFSIVAFCNSHGAFTGVLRASDQFWKYAAYQITLGTGIMITIAYARFMNDPSTASSYLYIWLITEILCFLLLIAFVVPTMYRGVDGVTDTDTTEKVGILSTWRFAVTTLMNSSLRMVTKEWDVVILSSVSGSTVAGAYKLGKQIATLPLLITDQFYFAIFPKIAQSWSAGATRVVRDLIRRISAWSVVSALLIVIGFSMIVGLLQNVDRLAQYSQVLNFVQLCLPSVFVAFGTFVFAPGLVASGNHAWQALALGIATACFLLSFAGAHVAGFVSAMPLALFVYYSTWALAASNRLRRIGGL